MVKMVSWLTFVHTGSDSTATSMAEELRHVLSFYSEDKAKVGVAQLMWLIFNDQQKNPKIAKDV